MAKKIIFHKFLAILCSLFVMQFVSASVGLPSKYRPPSAPTISGAEDDVTDINVARLRLTQRIVNVLFSFAGIIALYFLMNNAWWLITAGGTEETLTQHKKGMMWAIVGLLLVILSYSIIRFIITVPFAAHEGENTPPAAGAPADAPIDDNASVPVDEQSV